MPKADSIVRRVSPSETVSSLTRATDRRFDIRHDGEVASRLTADGENPLHITVAISPLYRKQGVRGHGTSAFRDAVQSLDLAGQGRPTRRGGRTGGRLRTMSRAFA